MGELIALLLVAVNGLLGAGATDAVLSQQIEQIVTQEPPVPVESVDIACQGATESGVDQIGFDFGEIYLEPLEVQHLGIGIEGLVRPPQGKLTLKSITWEATITDLDLTDALQRDNERFRDATVRIQDGVVVLKGTYPILGLKVPFEVEGTLSIEHSTELVFHITRNRIAYLPVPGGLNRSIEREVNPVYDLKAFAARSKKDMDKIREQLDYTFQVEVADMELGDGLIIVSGTA